MQFAIEIGNLGAQGFRLTVSVWPRLRRPARFGNADFIVDFYLVRHGEAVSEMSDPRRPLALTGRAAVDRLARLAAARGVRVSTILHSGILRARQTAEILAEHLAPTTGVRVAGGLSPEDEPALAAAELAVAPESVILVGHLPHLARLAGLLVKRDPEREIVEFKPAVMACVRRRERRWTLAWTLDPSAAGAVDR